MWTYLILFLSVVVLIAVFVRRSILVHLKKKLAALKPQGSGLLDEEAEQSPTPGKVSKSDLAKIDELLFKADGLVKSGQEDEAIKVFVQALAISSNHIETQQKLALLYLQKQMFGAAAALFKQLALLTNDAVHFSHLGFALYQQNAFEEAKEAYQKAVDVDSSRPQRFISLAQVYRALDQHQNAVIALTKAVELDKENAEYLLLLAQLHVDLNNLEDAINCALQIIELDAENEVANSLLKKLRKETSEK